MTRKADDMKAGMMLEIDDAVPSFFFSVSKKATERDGKIAAGKKKVSPLCCLLAVAGGCSAL